MKSIKCPSGTLVKVTETDFDKAGRPVAAWAPDAISGLVVRTTPGDPVLGSGVTLTTYDANGNAIAVTSQLGNITRTAYDSRNRAIKVAVNPATGNPADPAGAPGLNDEVTTTAYDQAGNPVSVTDARLNTSTTDYDPAGRAFRTTTPAVPVFGQSGNQPLVTENVFDKGGNITEAIDPAGYRTRNVYDAANRLIATATNPTTGNPSADPLNSPGSGDIVIRNEYDEGGNLRKVIDGLGQTTRFTYDGLSRKLSTIWDADDTRAKTDQVADYDALLQISSTDALGRVTVRHYDDNDRLIGIECAAATAESRTSILDQEGQVLKILHGGHDLPDTTALTADVRHVGMVYDRLGRVTSETSAGVAHTSTWDKGGNRLTVTYGGTGRVLTSTYDHLQRLDTLSEKLPAETTSRLTSYAYDKNGNVTAKTHPNGTSESTSYDALNRRMVHQVTVGSTVLSSFTFSHDAQSNVAQIIETYDASAGIAGRTVTNTYDKTRRLHVETAAEPGKTVATTYGYDKANNRTSKVVATTPTGGSTTTETHGYIYGNTTNGLNSNQVWKWIKPNGGGEVIYSYDANGNRATRTETIGGTPKTDTYTWDHWNRLTSLALQSKASAVNGTYSYGYDHRTRRIVRDESAISGRTRDLVIFSGGTSVQEHEGETGATPADEAAPDMEYIRGSDWGGGVGGILYTSRAGVVSWAHYNGRGDVVTRTSGTGSLTYAASYEAFGTRTQEAGTNPDRQRANTKEEDPTGLLNEGHRYRDLELGMFISRDPAGFVDGPNVYTYVVQNPWSSFDPEGLRAQSDEESGYLKQMKEDAASIRKSANEAHERYKVENPESKQIPENIQRSLDTADGLDKSAKDIAEAIDKVSTAYGMATRAEDPLGLRIALEALDNVYNADQGNRFTPEKSGRGANCNLLVDTVLVEAGIHPPRRFGLGGTDAKGAGEWHNNVVFTGGDVENGRKPLRFVPVGISRANGETKGEAAKMGDVVSYSSNHVGISLGNNLVVGATQTAPHGISRAVTIIRESKDSDRLYFRVDPQDGRSKR